LSLLQEKLCQALVVALFAQFHALHYPVYFHSRLDSDYGLGFDWDMDWDYGFDENSSDRFHVDSVFYYPFFVIHSWDFLPPYHLRFRDERSGVENFFLVAMCYSK